MANKKKKLSLDDLTVNESQARFLSSESGIDIEEIVDLKYGVLKETLGIYIDPRWWTHQRICGRVVQVNPLTGVHEGVPGAVVEVQDADCDLLFRKFGLYHWVYPFHCSYETIATAVTDECGNFCVWVPRWLTERVIKYRKETICFPIERPRLVDLVEIPSIVPDGGLIDPPEVIFDQVVDDRTAERVRDMVEVQRFGDSRVGLDGLLNERLTLAAPPVPTEADLVSFTPNPDAPIDWDLGDGPFVMCEDVYIPEVQIVKDVPDITFRVTQEIDGNDVLIYSEGFFDVRFNNTSVDDVELVTNGQARASRRCGPGHTVCVDIPEIQQIDGMSLDQTLSPRFHDNVSGYGLTVNRPSADGVNGPPVTSTPPVEADANAQSPLRRVVDLEGCVHGTGANWYRVMAKPDGGVAAPIDNVQFDVFLTGGGSVRTGTDIDGWIPVRTDLTVASSDLILEWDTRRFDNTRYELWVELSNDKVVVDERSDSQFFVIENRKPEFLVYTVEYRVGRPGHPSWATEPFIALPTDCPVIERGPNETVEIKATWRVNAPHLRNVAVNVGGCGAGSTVTMSPGSDPNRWHWQNAGDQDTGLHVTSWLIDADSSAGCYTLTNAAYSRAYNPAVVGATTPSFFGNDAYEYTRRTQSISIVDA